MIAKRSLLGGALVAGWLLTPGPVLAQSLSDSEKIERLQRQTELLQKQLKALQEEIRQAKKKAERTEAARMERPVDGSIVNAADRPSTREPKAQPRAEPGAPVTESWPGLDGVKITFGGYVAAESVFRTRNQVADLGTPFSAIPYPFSPLYHEREFHGSARGSRLSLLAEGKVDAAQSLAAYYESDFLGIGQDSNYTDTNNWAPRLRQAYLTYDNTDWGFHFLAGQAWSLVTQNKVGIIPRQENAPPTIDYSHVVGFDHTRDWQIRLVKDFRKTFWLGLAVENPAVVTASGNIPDTVNGVEVNFSNTGTGGFLNGVNVTTDRAPDIIVKAALDPGWGHYEVFGIQRFFTDYTFCQDPVPTGCTLNTVSSKTTFGTGVGGSVLLPVIADYLDLQASFLYGRGIGRYGSGRLPDVTIAADGSLAPLTGLHVLVGLVLHPWWGMDIYAYAGLEEVKAEFFDALGYGNPVFDNSGCTIVTAESFSSGTTSTCIANNRRLRELTVGFWQDFYKGPMGRLAFGAQYEYVKREAFTGIGGAPSTDNNVIYTSLRYYPF